MRISKASITSFSVEATSVDLDTARVVEFAAVRFDATSRDTEATILGVHPDCSIPPCASSVHGIHDIDVAVCKPFVFHVEDVARWLSGVVCGFNAYGYGAPLLCGEFRRAERTLYLTAVLDPLVWMRWLHPECKDYPAAVWEIYGVAADFAHDAVADARSAGELLFAMVAAGVVPDDVGDAMVEQAAHATELDQQQQWWGRYLYSRPGSGLRIGFGEYLGWRLNDAPKSFIRRCLASFDSDIPPGAYGHFKARVPDAGGSW